MNKKIAFRVDGNSIIGMGHLMRCLTIADEFRKNNFEVTFLSSSDTDFSEINKRGFNYKNLLLSTYKKWNISEIIEWFYNTNCLILFMDSYFVDSKLCKQLYKKVQIFYLDDCYSIDFPLKRIFNYNVEANPSLYEGCYNLSLGLEFFPLREELRCKNKSLSKDIKSVLITSGSTDNHCITLNIAKKLSQKYTSIEFKVVVGLFYESKYRIEIEKYSETHSNIKIVNWGKDYWNNFLDSGLIIAPGSTTIYEALSIGIPCISYEFVDNHHLECINLDKDGFVPFVGCYNDDNFYSDLMLTFEKELLYENRLKRYNRFKKVLDGNGVTRIYQQILEDVNENDN